MRMLDLLSFLGNGGELKDLRGEAAPEAISVARKLSIILLNELKAAIAVETGDLFGLLEGPYALRNDGASTNERRN